MVQVRTLCAAVLLVATAAGQEAQQKPKPASSLVIQLKSRRLGLDKAAAVLAELETRQTRFRLQASAALRKQFLQRQKDYEKRRASFSVLLASNVKANRVPKFHTSI